MEVELPATQNNKLSKKMAAIPAIKEQWFLLCHALRVETLTGNNAKNNILTRTQ